MCWQRERERERETERERTEREREIEREARCLLPPRMLMEGFAEKCQRKRRRLKRLIGEH